MAVKVYTLSDLHIDYRDNFVHLLKLNDHRYLDSALIVPGDVTDNLDKLRELLQHFTEIFKAVFYVPGNHELWIRDNNTAPSLDSIDKFDAILQMCDHLGVHTEPVKFGSDINSVWIVPLFSWYTKAEQGQDSLYRPKAGDDQTEMLWVDNRCCRWSSLPKGKRVVDYFLELNHQRINAPYDAPVISFSHFLPLTELIFPINYRPNASFVDPMPEFNFTRVAGTTHLAEQIQQLGSVIHIHGHQHRNRHRTIDGVIHISHCLGYPRERETPYWRGSDQPKLIWHDGTIAVDFEY